MAENQQDIQMHKDFIEFWKNKDVYAYIKSQDNRWLYESDENLKKNKSHYADQYCEYPWISTTVMADGNVVRDRWRTMGFAQGTSHLVPKALHGQRVPPSLRA